MKAEYSPRIDLGNRVKLEEVIPLEAPFVVFIDPSDACNFKCRFCPTSDRDLMKSIGRPWRQLPFELFTKIADGMLEFPKKVKVLRLYKDGEPLLNKRLTDMVRYAKDIGASDRVDTTTNAALLTAEKGRDIAASGLDRINISVYGVNNEQYKSFSGVNLQFEKVLENIRNFYEIRGSCEMLVKINGDSLSEKEKEIFLEMFGDISDKIYIEHTMSCWPEFELRGVGVNQNVGLYGQELGEVDTCPYPFYSMAINSDGLASLCFLDWGRKLSIGNLNHESIRDVWTSKTMRSYQKMFLEGERKKHSVCGNCGQMSHGSPDNIDIHASQVLKKLNLEGYFDGVESPSYRPSSIPAIRKS